MNYQDELCTMYMKKIITNSSIFIINFNLYNSFSSFRASLTIHCLIQSYKRPCCENPLCISISRRLNFANWVIGRRRPAYTAILPQFYKVSKVLNLDQVQNYSKSVLCTWIWFVYSWKCNFHMNPGCPLVGLSVCHNFLNRKVTLLTLQLCPLYSATVQCC